jgi:hypothetical protein
VCLCEGESDGNLKTLVHAAVDRTSHQDGLQAYTVCVVDVRMD